jgi:hypothetical protein
MHTILFKKADGGVANYPPTPEVIALMTGRGYDWDTARINREAAKFTVPNVSGTWPGFSLEFGTEWATAAGRGGLTEDEVFDLIKRRIQLRRGYTASALVEPDTLPHHLTCEGNCAEEDCCGRYFRDAIVWDDGVANKCTCDMDKCRGVHMDKIRLSRNAELVKEDVTFMRAVEAGDASTQSTVATKKQVLRDIPATFDITTGVTTPELLKAKWPSELPARE